MKAAFSKAEIQSEIASRFGSAFTLQEKRPAEIISTGIPQIDAFTLGGLPRGAITEVFGPASSALRRPSTAARPARPADLDALADFYADAGSFSAPRPVVERMLDRLWLLEVHGRIASAACDRSGR